MAVTFRPGETVSRREVLHGHLWLSHPVTVVADDGDVLATRLDPGSAFDFPEHPFGPHPWRTHSQWGGSIVLHLSRAGTAYGVWKFFEADGRFRHWYVNFEPPSTRVPGGYETGDHGLDLVVWPDGRREWKDVADLHHQRVEGRISLETVAEVLGTAAEVVDLLDADRRWWSAWDAWTP
jgi:hypothetical protein